MPKIVFLWSDVVVLLLLAALFFYAWRVRRSPNLRVTWHKVLRDPPALCSAVVLVVFLFVAVVDSLHYRSALAAAALPTRCPSVRMVEVISGSPACW
jgi:peptide/nickel transport system permease protein